MLGLKNIDDRFEIEFTIIENGAGIFYAIIDEITQSQAPSYVFSPPRRLLRVDPSLAINTSMIVRSAGGTNYLLGEHGDAETVDGIIFRSFRMFSTHLKFDVSRRVTQIEPITGLPMDDSHTVIANIWGTYEPLPEIFDRETRVPTETARFITNYPVQRQDIIDGKSISRVDKQLGLYIATLA